MTQLYLVSKKLPRRLRYRDATYALHLGERTPQEMGERKQHEHLYSPPTPERLDAPAASGDVPPEDAIDFKEALDEHIIPIHELTRINWDDPVITDITDVMVQGVPVRGGKTTLTTDGPPYVGARGVGQPVRKYTEPIKLVFTWAYEFSEGEDKPKLVHLNLEPESTHEFADPRGTRKPLDNLIFQYLQNSVDPFMKQAPNRQITTPRSQPQQKKKLFARALRYEGYVYLLADPSALALEPLV